MYLSNTHYHIETVETQSVLTKGEDLNEVKFRYNELLKIGLPILLIDDYTGEILKMSK